MEVDAIQHKRLLVTEPVCQNHAKFDDDGKPECDGNGRWKRGAKAIDRVGVAHGLGLLSKGKVGPRYENDEDANGNKISAIHGHAPLRLTGAVRGC